MPYTPERPALTESSEQLRARIPGWGADLNREDRPSVPKLDRGEGTGVPGEFPERQPEKWPRERSIEHKFLTPVFGTSCPPHGLSGALRKYSYRKYSEGRAAHWLLLLGADRVDAWEQHLRSFLTLRPDNPITETGVLSEFTRHGISSRFGKKRADVKHQWLDPFIVAGPWLLMAALVWSVVRKASRSRPARRTELAN
ncbi:hypothetical protein P3102_25180 [Amycolatopsis sp. QT-25]|uniref:hypothetical protein n=1 Tax=Amycolatopsis sp. QT-25 TaxID=3034022 RepID=UPI0023EDA82C|nr:hypothetical protein [Amycolatopsis sp. QT-25]WET77365.1 hypothetical protein P3102_25180 [Amycolatopsis sp. QT-25]